MPPRKRSSNAKPIRLSPGRADIARDAQNDAHLTPGIRSHSRASPSESGAGYSDPTTTSYAIAHSQSGADALLKPPIHCLPLEVLCEIFILALPSDYEICKRLQINPARRDHKQRINPLLFCAVCSLWWSIGFSTAQLWKQVFIFAPHITKVQAEEKAVNLVQWIKRSGSLPLTLHISVDTDMSLVGIGPIPILSVLNHYAARWETFYLHYTTTGDYQSPAAPSPEVSFDFASWHSLRRIRSTYIYPTVHQNQTVPWAQLTDLHICAYIPYSRAISMLRECLKLVRLSIAVWRMDEVHASPIVTLHDLVTLSLRTDCLSRVVESISLPNLRNIYISELSSTQLGSLLDFFTRSSCNLDKLVIHETHLPSGDHLNLLAHKSCNLLSSLTINNTWLDIYLVEDDLLRRLTLHQHDSLCTHLKVLTMTCYIRDGASSALLNMVESRFIGQLPDGPLQYLELFVPRDYVPKLDEICRRSGVEYTCQTHRGELNYVFSVLMRPGFRQWDPYPFFNFLLLDEM